MSGISWRQRLAERKGPPVLPNTFEPMKTGRVRQTQPLGVTGHDWAAEQRLLQDEQEMLQAALQQEMHPQTPYSHPGGLQTAVEHAAVGAAEEDTDDISPSNPVAATEPDEAEPVADDEYNEPTPEPAE